jgi:hypothetical protein
MVEDGKTLVIYRFACPKIDTTGEVPGRVGMAKCVFRIKGR